MHLPFEKRKLFTTGGTVMSDKITKSIIIKGTPAQIFKIWANFENFPRFMKHILAVQKTGDKTSHWVMKGPLGKDFHWNAQITEYEENKRIAWNSIDGDLKTSGQVTFADLGLDETEITVMIHYVPPAGKVGEAAARIFDNPEKRLEEDLRQFKKYAESLTVSTAQRSNDV
jgi:uncharacterized membrane protein